MKVFADKLINILESHREEISQQWCKAVRSNPRTPSYHPMEKEKCVVHAINFYKNLKKIYFSEKPYAELRDYFIKYASESYKEGIPLHESVYALIMMRRHMWLYADFQAPFLTSIEHHQAVETINKTIRIFDHGIYLVIQKYLELIEDKEK
ncbi:MAG: hypothetical protein JW743_06455 [Deltaproteobacteria bacterium]|nr:hypothetical protein [Deltaproteobacteria bacterium]MBN2845314.1 hypothetical protein [Deltaproteobacteria bacterium]